MRKALLGLVVGICLFFHNAYAATYDATVSGDGYIFNHSFSGDNSFNDYIAFSTEGTQSILASVSGTGATFTFTGFNLLDSDKNLIETGTVFNVDSQVSFGFTKSVQEGNYFLQVMGESTGATAGYTGNITLTTIVPEPGIFALMLPGIALLACRNRRKTSKTTQ